MFLLQLYGFAKLTGFRKYIEKCMPANLHYKDDKDGKLDALGEIKLDLNGGKYPFISKIVFNDLHFVAQKNPDYLQVHTGLYI